MPLSIPPALACGALRARVPLLAAAVALGSASLQAQEAPAPQPAASAPLERTPLDPRQNQRIERIRIEDAGSRIDELRVGGQTQSITVQPKSGLPAYEVQPGSGQRVWNVLGF